jgi:hypothetical protein
MIVAYRTNTDRPKAHLVLDGRIDRPRFAVRTAVMRCGMKIADKDIKIALKDPTGQVNDAPDYQE